MRLIHYQPVLCFKIISIQDCPAFALTCHCLPKELATAASSAGMWHHARLLRRVLLLVSVVTLSGLHVHDKQQTFSWRAARLLSLTLCFVSAASNIAYIVAVIDDAFNLMYSIVLDTAVFHGSVMQLYILYNRHRIYGLLQSAVELDKTTGDFYRAGDYTQVLCKTAYLCCISVCYGSCWFIGFLVGGELKPPRFLAGWYVPPPLQGSSWYWLIITG